ncbi:MAG: Holliday junction branch migration protein RuvA [Deltaproteobacteria bacterium]|nr:Holliday junction branch migration protein RuvA [Deltaproteobacteria bacterium]
MIGRLTGTVVDQGLDGTVLLDVNGVGYEVLLPMGTLGRLGGSDEPVTVHIHTHAREDSLLLYGFENADDKAAFRSLLGVSNVGPKSALAVLGTLDAEALHRAVETDDRAALKGIPGVGKKTIERILLDLKGKIVLRGSMTIGTPQVAPRRSADTMGGIAGQVVGLLTSMGYKRAEAESCVAALETEGKSTEDLLREALRSMG